jgi:hypothetical protein
MRRHVVENLARNHLLAQLPGFIVTRGIIHKSLSDGLLRGFWLDSSAFDPNAAYVYVFVQPLYVPRQHLVFNLGKRLASWTGFLRSNERWDLNPRKLQIAAPFLLRAMLRDGLAFLKKRDNAELLVRNLKYGLRFETTIFDREALAYSLARLGRYYEAERRLKSLIRSLGAGHVREDVRENSAQLLAAIQGGPDYAQSLLHRWTAETSRHLRPPASA